MCDPRNSRQGARVPEHLMLSPPLKEALQDGPSHNVGHLWPRRQNYRGLSQFDLDLQIVLAGSPERTTNVAGDLCEDGPMLTRPYDHKLVLDHTSSVFLPPENGQAQ